MLKKTLLLCLGLGLFCAMPSWAAEWYLDAQNGLDTNDCISTSTPCQTLTASAFKASGRGGDTIYLKGTFTSNFNFGSNLSGTAAAYTRITAWPGEAHPVFSLGGTVNGINLNDNADYFIIDNLDIYQAKGSGITLYKNNDYIVIKENNINNSNFGALTLGGNGAASNVIIENNFFYKNNITGASTIEIVNASYVYIYNNTIYSNIKTNGDGTVMNLGTGADYLYLKNNIFHTATRVMGGSSIPSHISSNNNDYYNMTDGNGNPFMFNGVGYSLASWQTLTGQDLNSLQIDPLFVSTDAATLDLHLQTTSALIDAGSTDVADVVTTDYDGESCPYAASYEIGADELPIVSAPTDLENSNVTKTSGTISWTAPTTALTSYTVQTDTLADFSTATETSGLTDVTLNLTELSKNTDVYFRVKAVYVTDYGTYESAWATSSMRTLPKKVQDVNVPKKFREKKQVKVTWDNAGADLTYEVKLMTSKNVKIKTYTTENIYKVIKNLTAGHKYHVKVRAFYDDTHTGSWSEIISFQTLPKTN